MSFALRSVYTRSTFPTWVRCQSCFSPQISSPEFEFSGTLWLYPPSNHGISFSELWGSRQKILLLLSRSYNYTYFTSFLSINAFIPYAFALSSLLKKLYKQNISHLDSIYIFPLKIFYLLFFFFLEQWLIFCILLKLLELSLAKLFNSQSLITDWSFNNRDVFVICNWKMTRQIKNTFYCCLI